MRRRPPLMLICGAIAVGALLAGCGSDDSSSSTAASTTTTGSEPATSSGSSGAQSTDKIDIADFKFDPEAVTVDAGTTVTWTNSDDADHTATADDGSFDTGTLSKGDTGTATFDKPGTYSYSCNFHPFMKATVEVQ